MSEKNNIVSQRKDNQQDIPDDITAVMIYGNLKIIDVQTGKMLVNKRA
jgi:hypothetical protein